MTWSWVPGRASDPPLDLRSVGVGRASRRLAASSGIRTTSSSAASAWEIATKHRVGKYPAGGPIIAEWSDRIARDGFRQLDVSCAHALRAGSLPGDHRDPFDRMLAAQGMMETIRVATPDPAIATLGADTIW